jgi:hypothetical protein
LLAVTVGLTRFGLRLERESVVDENVLANKLDVLVLVLLVNDTTGQTALLAAKMALEFWIPRLLEYATAGQTALLAVVIALEF